MIDFIKDADCTKETPVKLGVPDAPIYGKGQFMMTISEQELQKIAPKVLENKIKKYLGGLGK